MEYKCGIPNLEFLLYIYFLNYDDNRLTSKNVMFGFRGPQNVSIHQNIHFENLTPKQYFLSLWVRESNKRSIVVKPMILSAR